ncbi:MAG: DUF4440 domain-containing protein [Aquabacterium sp.]|nr:DUF4440 domain-containing protein [Ferruginibacter sp.]
MFTEITDMPAMARQFLEHSRPYLLPLKVPYIGMGSSYFAPLAFKYMGIQIYPELASEFYNYQNTDTTQRGAVSALEKAGWEAWKSKDAAWFQTNLTEDFVMVNSEGLGNKARVLKSTPTDCMVKSFSLDSFKFGMLNESAVLLTYTAMQDAVCNGKTIPAKVWATVNYVQRGGKWLEAMYMETPLAQ